MPTTAYRPVVVDANQLPHFLTVEQAAQIIGMGRAAAYEAVKRGEIPTVKFGRRLRVPRHALLALGGGQDA
jgi:excisionase family DNA binding protein